MVERTQVPSRQYRDEFKVEAVRLAESIGENQAANWLEISDSSMWNWLRLSRAGELNAMHRGNGQVKPGPVDLEAKNERLCRELANAKLDVEILKKRRRSSQWNRGEVRLGRVLPRTVSSGASVPLDWRITHRLLPMARQAAQQSYHCQCGFGRQCGEPSRAKRPDVWPVANC